jgi:serine protease Do
MQFNHRRPAVPALLPMLLSAAILAAEAGAQAAPAPQGGEAPAQPAQARQAEAARAFAGAFTEVATNTLPAVVSVLTERTAAQAAPFPFGDPFDFFFGRPSPQAPAPPRQEQGLGSGVIIQPDGLIITNNHVVEGARKITVRLSDQREFDARIIGRDPPTDLAVLRIEGNPGKLPTLPFGDSDSLQIGEWVVAVGAPFGLYQSVTSGIVSALGRQGTGIATYGNFIQTDAAINPGNSGGPLVDLEGRLMGVNTAIYSQSGGYQGIGFAIPANLARRVTDDLVKTGKVTRGWLGVSIQTITPSMAEALGLKETRGALVGDVLSGGPAAKAGLQVGDVILRVGDRQIQDANDLMNTIAQMRPGTTANLALLRDGKTVTKQVRIAERQEERTAAAPQAPAEGGDVPSLGLQVAPLTPQVRQQFEVPKGIEDGVAVAGVAPGGRADRAGLEQGDIILEANREDLESVQELRTILEKAKEGQNILLLISRQGNSFFTTIQAG